MHAVEKTHDEPAGDETLGRPRASSARRTSTTARLEQHLHAASELLIAAGLDHSFPELLDRIVTIVRAATGADGAFLHLWDEDKERLVLSAATEGTAKAFLHQIELKMGQGLAGLAALRRQPVVVNSDPSSDPHYEYFPELEEDKYRSTAKFPVLRDGSTLIGVLSLNSEDRNSFHDDQLVLAKDLTRLAAGIIGRAARGGTVERNAEALRRLGDLATTLCSSRPEYEVLGAVTATTAKLLSADLVVLALTDRETGDLSVKALAPYRSDVLDSLASISRGEHPSSGGVRSSRTLERYLEVELVEQIGAVATVTLAVGDDRMGTLNCYRPKRLSAEDHDILSLIGRQIALALNDASERWGNAEMSGRAFLDRLARCELDEHGVSMATAVGANLSRPQVMVAARIGRPSIADVSSGHDVASRGLACIDATIKGSFPGSITSCSFDQLVGMVEVRDDGGDRRLERRLAEAVADFKSRNGSAPRVGLSRVARLPTDLHRALLDAHDALHIGTLLGESHVVHHDDLASRIHIYRMVLDPSFDRDPTVALVRKIESYDTEHGTDLLNTLDVYMACHANSSSAAEALNIHRNTLRQRMDRIAHVSELSLDDPAEWLSIQLAVRGVRLRHSSHAVTSPEPGIG